MSILDHSEQWRLLDPSSMSSLIESFPEQLEAAAAQGRGLALEPADGVRALLVTGLGGSAICGDLLRMAAGGELKVPLIVNRDYELPGFLGPSSLVVACSYSGNTEETLGAYEQARSAGARIVAITSGGRLEQLAKADGFALVCLPGGLPPRAALGYSLSALLTALESMGLLAGVQESLREAVGLLKGLRAEYGTANPEEKNAAKRIAHSLHGKIPVLYGSAGIMESAALRWRTQIAENAKNLAFHHALPEMNHNELVGWVFPGEALSGIGVILLRDSGDHAQVQRRFTLTRELIEKKAGVLHEVWSQGESRLARLLSVVYLGDFVSLYLAYLNGVDPTPVEVIDYLKRKLGSRGGVD